MGDLFVQGINDTTLYAEKLYSQNFTAANKKFVLSLDYKRNIVKEILCLENNSDNWTVANAQKTEFWGEIFHFAVDYTSTNIGDIYNVQRYLLKRRSI